MPTTEELLRRINQLERENGKLREKLARAKDPEPVQKPSLSRVNRLAGMAGMEVRRHTTRGYVLIFGRAKHWYRRLRTLWEIFIQDSWELSELFPPKKVLAPVPKRPSLRRNPSLVPPRSPMKAEWWNDNIVPFS
ncbi:MAG: hypothetical protein AAFO04_30040 [Cyanobacteria bacterium J06592_8]